MGTARQSWLLFAVPTALVGVACGWALAQPESPTPSSAVRALCLVLGSAVLGLAALCWWSRGDSRPLGRDDRLWRLSTAIAGAWMLAEAVLLAMTASEADALALSELSVGRFGAYVTEISAGRVDVAVLACTVAAIGWSAVAFRRSEARIPVPVLVLAALALVARPITGHMSQQVLGSVLDVVHALAAAVWFGLLAALGLMLRSRGDWSSWLPRYSSVAWRCVWLLTATGVIDAAVRLGGVTPLFDTGYGRIVLAKAVALAALLGLGWWWRRTWVGQASAHRISAEASLRRAIFEVVVMAVPFGLAAALATTA
ncbi:MULTISPECIES: CopD family protein [unclassified Rhodococcus (in: high G+C Gram-positive bacteria)]|uniref:CopD family protein n=1 Tax=unclassified Rhodococcus (in: high G+C Gram-positive bacteria) TaxID=192944 RepID=UPI00163B5E09|nr:MULTISPECIES: CopD family protein [unclassified Rhodococcus (in: high G+C Gram-positive bacteria)]MBC2641347.1 CopD family protein [Rhodococcus sp. 3A]MBC2893908.1 CopD family protein [Rhodococcus sp. 4CII]